MQDELVTIRGERFVIPVKVEQKRRVQGVVHGASSSGQTVFVEPLETIEQNNELVRLLDEEQAEVHRILLEMTRRIGEHAEAIRQRPDVLAELELQFAKARFAEEYDCVAAVPSAAYRRRWTAPALETVQRSGYPVTPDSASCATSFAGAQPKAEETWRCSRQIELEGERRQLIITGPNTGGKTVTLKTVGLLALMAQSGIPVPADRAELPVFDAVLADIGDYQSIEQNLSTFSAHVTNIDFISRTATPDSLVLLDELGSATDPEEGAALAVAIADHFRAMGCISMISTHHTSLKVYGANTAGVLNAAVGFDEPTLQPTYELRIGVPGASAGINIAQRLGLNPAIIASARANWDRRRRTSRAFSTGCTRICGRSKTSGRNCRQREYEIERETQLDAEGRKEQRAKIREMEKKMESLLARFRVSCARGGQCGAGSGGRSKLSKDAERRIAKLRREFREQFDSTVVAHVTGADRGDPHAQP